MERTPRTCTIKETNQLEPDYIFNHSTIENAFRSAYVDESFPDGVEGLLSKYGGKDKSKRKDTYQKIMKHVSENIEVTRCLLEAAVRFQKQAKEIVCQYMTVRNLGWGAEKRKPFNIMFAGPSGVGKSEIAKSMASILSHGGPRFMISCNQYSDDADVAKLCGAPSGCIGSDEKKGMLATWIKHWQSLPEPRPPLVRIKYIDIDR